MNQLPWYVSFKSVTLRISPQFRGRNCVRTLLHMKTDRIFTLFLVVCSLNVLIGCTSKYTPPTTGSVALVRFSVKDSNQFAMLHTYSREDCQDPLAIGLIGGANFVNATADQSRVIPSMMGSSGVPESQIIELRIPGNRPFTSLYSQMGPGDRTCKLHVTFTPSGNEQYEIAYSYESGNPGHCSAVVSRMYLNQQQNVLREPVASAHKEVNACRILF